MKFKFRTSGTRKYFKVKNGDGCIFDEKHGIQYVSPCLGEIVLLPGFKPIDNNSYIDIIRK